MLFLNSAFLCLFLFAQDLSATPFVLLCLYVLLFFKEKRLYSTQACCCCFSLYTTLSLRVHFWDGFHCSFQHYKHSQQKIDLLEKYENSNFHSFDEHIHDFFPLFAKKWRDFPSVVLLISFQALAFLLPNLCSI